MPLKRVTQTSAKERTELTYNLLIEFDEPWFAVIVEDKDTFKHSCMCVWNRVRCVVCVCVCRGKE